MQQTRHEDPKQLLLRYNRAQAMIENKDVWRQKELVAYLLTPREEFVLDRNRTRAYESAFLDIGYGVTISGPHLVGRMTSTIDVQPTDRVLEIGTGSGYQSAVISHLTDQVYTIEIIEPLGKRSARQLRTADQAGYSEYWQYPHQDRRRLFRLGRCGALRQDHRHLRHRPYPAARCCSS